MSKIVEITDVPQEDVGDTVANLAQDGASVEVKSQSDGLFTIRATFPTSTKKFAK